MPDPALDVGDDLPGIGLVPAPVKVLGDRPELDDEVAREVLRLGLAALFPPQPHQGRLIVAHDDPGVRAADEVAAVVTFGSPENAYPSWPLLRPRQRFNDSNSINYREAVNRNSIN